MITLEKVCFAYEHEVALRYIDLHIEKGDSLVIQGPNGCGKSTLIKLLNGIIFPSEGYYFYKDHEITEKALKDRQFAKWFHQQMGYVFQNADTQLFCGSVEEEVAFGPIQMRLPEAEVRERTEDCLQLFGIEKLLITEKNTNIFPRTISKNFIIICSAAPWKKRPDAILILSQCSIPTCIIRSMK